MNRKELVQALEAKWGVKARYLGMPSCAYEINRGEGIFQVDRHGVIRDKDGREFSPEELLHDTAAEPTEPSEVQIGEYVVEMPLDGHTVTSLRNLLNMLVSKQHLIMSAFELTQPLLDASLAKALQQIPMEDLESFQTAWTVVDSERSPGLEQRFEKQTLAMKLIKDNPTSDEMTAFCNLAACVNDFAKKRTHCSSKLAQEDNPKFAFRTWLLRLGMNGDDFKTTRKVLLARLAGNGAFRTPAEEAKHKERLLAKKAGITNSETT